MDVLMIVRSDVAHDARVVREATALVAAGHRVHVVGKDVPAGWTPPAGVTVAGVPASSVFDAARGAVRGGSGRAGSGRALSGRALSGRGLLRWMLLPEHNAQVWSRFLAAAERAADAERADRVRTGGRGFDVVHAHDFPVLPLAALLAARWDARLVYDAHELWSGRLRAGRPTPVRDARELAAERRLGARADAVLTVSEPIAERMREWGFGDVRVVRNTFPLAGLPAPQAPATVTGAVYAGRLGAGRDLEAVIGAARLRPDLRWALVGPGDAGYLAGLDVPAGMQVRPTLPVDAVDVVLREYGLSLVTLEDTCENHRVALPNKLFQAVRAGVPVVAADLPAMRALVERHDLGTLYTPGDPASLADAVARAVEAGSRFAAGAARARSELAWERDAQVLVEVYDRLPAGPAR